MIRAALPCKARTQFHIFQFLSFITQPLVTTAFIALLLISLLSKICQPYITFCPFFAP
nr:MAG TPA: hypothetical protein [Caudoviricetes sp.]